MGLVYSMALKVVFSFQLMDSGIHNTEVKLKSAKCISKCLPVLRHGGSVQEYPSVCVDFLGAPVPTCLFLTFA